MAKLSLTCVATTIAGVNTRRDSGTSPNRGITQYLTLVSLPSLIIILAFVNITPDFSLSHDQDVFICYRTQVRFCFSAVCDFFILFFLFAYEISREPLNGFAPNSQEDVLLLRLDEFECQGQRSKVKVTRDKKTRLALLSYEWYALAANSV